MELGILRTLLKVPGGYSFADYSPAASLSATQLEGRAGSITLKRETMSFGIVEETNPISCERIKHVLQTDGFGVSMLILVGQVRSRILFESTSGAPKPVKLVGNLYDSCQVVSSILLEFLTDDSNTDNGSSTSSSILKYAENLPTLESLNTKYGFDAESTWMLCRPLVRSTMGNSEMELDGKGGERLKLFTLTEEFRKSYQAMLPGAAWNMITTDLFESFYIRNLYDIFCPENVYTNEINRVNKEIERNQQRQKGGTAIALNVGPAPQKNEGEELERLKAVSRTLALDLENQKEHVEAVLDSLAEKKGGMFKSGDVSADSAKAFLIHCIYPRAMQSPNDAMYCARFVFHLHKLETAGFSTLHCIDELISVVSGSLFGVTEGEAAHLAILLWEIWKVVNSWRYEKGRYEDEVVGKPGSFMLTPEDDGEEIKPEATPHKDFVSLYNTWHASLGAALIGCLQSSEYMHKRAGLVTLTRLVEVFPTRPKLGNKLFRVLTPLQDENNARPDIRASANAYGTMLLKARDDGKWVEEDAAVVKARVEKEKAAAEARKKKIAQQFEEMERDSAKITEQIGPRDGPRDRRDHRREPRDFTSPRASTPGDSERGRNSQPRPGAGESSKGRRDEKGGYSRMESGEVVARDRRDVSDRGNFRSSPPRDTRGRERDERGHGRNERAGSPVGRSGGRQHGDNFRREGAIDSRRGGRDEPRGSERGRWTRGETQPAEGRGRASKRTRPPSPEPVSENRGSDRASAKRPRLTQDAEPKYNTRRGARSRSRSRSPPSRPRSRKRR